MHLDLPPLIRDLMLKSLPDLILQPTTEEHLLEIFAMASEHKNPIDRQGEREPGGYGGAVPTRGGILIDLGLMNTIDIKGKDVTVDALLPQRNIAGNLVTERHAHYHFTVKGNQRGVLEDVALWFENRKQPDFVHHTPPTMDESKLERSGPPPNSTTTSTFPVSDRPLPSNANSSTKNIVPRDLLKWLMVSPANAGANWTRTSP
jgi:predicted transposase YbfD/YdcC